MPYAHKLSDLNMRLADIESIKPLKNGVGAKVKLSASSRNIYDTFSGCIIQKISCLRCNCTFKADLQKMGLSYNLLCPYCGREDQLRTCSGMLL